MRVEALASNIRNGLNHFRNVLHTLEIIRYNQNLSVLKCFALSILDISFHTVLNYTLKEIQTVSETEQSEV